MKEQHKHFIFDGLHSHEDFGLLMPTDPQISFPGKIKDKLKIPGTNTYYSRADTSLIVPRTDRTIKVSVNMAEYHNININTTLELAGRTMDWLSGSVGRKPLQLSSLPGWYFMAEVENEHSLQTGFNEYGVLEVEFLAYPYRIRKFPMGHDYWNDFMFEHDNSLKPEYNLPSATNSYNTLKAGDVVTVAGWGPDTYGSGANLRYLKQFSSDPFFKVVSFNGTEYTLTDGVKLRPINIVQAQKKYTTVQLFNPSNEPAIPEVVVTAPSPYQGVTIEYKGFYYSIKQGEENTRFALMPGWNEFKVYGYEGIVEFIWHKEMI